MVAALVDYPREGRLELVGGRSAKPLALGPRPIRPRATRPGLCRPAPARAEVYRRRRLAAAAILLIGLALLIMVTNLAVQAALGRTGGGPLTATGALPGGQLAGSEVYVVRPGDTVWSIAQSIAPNSDVRPLVDRISAQLRGTQLYPGERLRLPTSR